MVNSKKSIGNQVKRIVIVLLLVLAGLVVLSTISHQILKVVEKNKYPAPGKYVQVNGKKMHVYSEGNGNQTIVLLGGYGTGSPVIDFAPLIKELRDSYQVVVVENFGYGWSDVTKTPRTTENIVNETRIALDEAGFAPPYILMPHSIWGLYSLYYANTYPNEIQSIVGIDSTVPSQIEMMSDDMKMSSLSKLEEITGYVRIIIHLMPELVVSKAASEAYTPEEVKLMGLMYCWHANNASLINEYNEIYSNLQGTHNLVYPDSIPVLFLLSDETTHQFNDLGMDWISMHEQLITTHDYSKVSVLSGSHYLHGTCSSEMAEEVIDFFSEAFD